MRITIDMDDEPAAPPAGVLSWNATGRAEFTGWIELLRLLETAIRRERGMTPDAGRRLIGGPGGSQN